MMCRSGPGTRPYHSLLRGSVAAPGLGGVTGRPVQGVPSFRGNLCRSRGRILMDFGQGRQGVHVLEVTATARATVAAQCCHRVW